MLLRLTCSTHAPPMGVPAVGVASPTQDLYMSPLRCSSVDLILVPTWRQGPPTGPLPAEVIGGAFA